MSILFLVSVISSYFLIHTDTVLGEAGPLSPWYKYKNPAAIPYRHSCPL